MSRGKPFDLIGQQFGNLLVLEKAESLIIGGKKVTAFKCRCTCGVEKVIAGFYLVRGSCRSCGCKEHVRDSSDIIKRLFIYYKHAARRRKGLDSKDLLGKFTLSFEEFKVIILSDCHYCGKPPSNQFRQKLKNGDQLLAYSGIDRMDSTKSYLSGNCVPCCFICNTMKNNLSYSDFVEHISLLYKRLCLPKPIS